MIKIDQTTGQVCIAEGVEPRERQYNESEEKDKGEAHILADIAMSAKAPHQPLAHGCVIKAGQHKAQVEGREQHRETDHALKESDREACDKEQNKDKINKVHGASCAKEYPTQ